MTALDHFRRISRINTAAALVSRALPYLVGFALGVALCAAILAVRQ